MVTVSSSANRSFTQGRGTYVCDCCLRRTRETTVQGSDLCGLCFDLAGLQNAVWDGCFTEADRPERDAILAKITKLGGREISVRAEFVDLFAA